MKLRSDKPLMFGIGLLAALLVVNASLAWRNNRQVRDDGRWVLHTQHVIALSGEVLGAVLDAETGQRGFLITSHDEFLEPYDAALPRVERLLAKLKEETADNPEQQARVVALADSIGMRLDFLKQGIVLRRRSAEEASAFIVAGQGRTQMQAVRGQIAEFQAVENRLLEARTQRSGRAYRLATGTGLVAAALGLMVIALFAWVLARSLRARREALAGIHKLRESDARFKAVFDAHYQFWVLLTPDGTVVDANETCFIVGGFPREEVLGRKMWDTPWTRTLPAMHEMWQRHIDKVARSGQSLDGPSQFATAGGDVRDSEYGITAVRDESGRVTSLIVQGRDITPYKQAEATLRERGDVEREARRRLRRVLDSLPQKVFTATPAGEIDFYNPLWMQFTGRSFEALKDSGWKEIVHPQDLENNVQIWTRAVAAGEPCDLEHRLRRADGEYRWHRSRAVPLKDEAGQVEMWVGANADVHDEKQKTIESRRLAEDLSEADSRKNEFLAMLAHELRNPLAPIRNSARILRRSGEAVQSASEMMERQIGQMVRLVDDLLDINRISRGKIELRRERVEVAAAINDAVDAARSQFAASGVELSLKLPPQPLYLEADPARLSQIVGNLLNNACKFTDRGGQVWLAVEPEGGQVAIRVRDSGVGIAADQLPWIFEMFSQIDASLGRSQGGLGIGLALVRNLVELHGGSVEAQSLGVGQGSEFTVRLPALADAASTALCAPAAEENAAPITGHRILVVDDNRDSAESLELLLKLSGNDARAAYDGLEALDLAERFRPGVVLLDLGLPKLDGYEVARRIREQSWGQDMRLVAVTGWGQPEDRKKTKAAGFDGHLVKPLDYDTLTQLLNDLQARAEENPQAADRLKVRAT